MSVRQYITCCIGLLTMLEISQIAVSTDTARYSLLSIISHVCEQARKLNVIQCGSAGTRWVLHGEHIPSRDRSDQAQVWLQAVLQCWCGEVQTFLLHSAAQETLCKHQLNQDIAFCYTSSRNMRTWLVQIVSHIVVGSVSSASGLAAAFELSASGP